MPGLVGRETPRVGRTPKNPGTDASSGPPPAARISGTRPPAPTPARGTSAVRRARPRRPPSEASSVRGGSFRLVALGRAALGARRWRKAPEGCPGTPSTLPEHRRRRIPWIAVSSSAPGGGHGSCPETAPSTVNRRGDGSHRWGHGFHDEVAYNGRPPRPLREARLRPQR